MVEVRWTLQAAQDLESIVKFIARDSSHYARLFAVDTFRAIDRITLFPESGRIVPEIGDPVIREAIIGSYRLVYRLKDKCVEILTVFHGARQFDPSRLT
ncbi:MAG: plasmid stabilization protein [Candidatus Lindowbacteria bacterium RIFCSPLOWO2_12_FULL_62_27]|nr:MAG: plasmid stabilization protein [Candidatus Lindowbacteria bacterium RIFCSPLOWO2_12_FULL_62_27]OGH63487.1 MAG: plasmid stabilization protein [Candidatus Lindowbacteria bacterium RIFCSPLOWO2_02_FULL_62_12]